VTLNADDINYYAFGAGFDGADLDTAVQIALKESSGRTDAVGDLTLGRSIGLWQINLHYHPEYDEESLKDPAVNAAAAFKIYQAAGNSFTPWSTYNGGVAGGAGGGF
jgi:hypothetical protein